MAKGWRRIMSGWYEYNNAAGKTLAYVERHYGHWNVTILPLGDPAGARVLRESPHTYREAKELAQREYRAASVVALRENAAALERIKHM